MTCEDMVLKDVFPELFAIAMCHEATLFSYLSEPVRGNPHSWNRQFFRDFNDWELEGVSSFITLLVTFASDLEDLIFCMDSGPG